MTRVLRLTEDLVRLVHRDIPDSGPSPGVAVFSEEDYDTDLREFLTDRPDGPIFVFVYGSLIWKPVFQPARTFKAVAPHWRRSFCLRLVRFRGTPDQPGLMMQLDTGDGVEGVLQQLDDATAEADLHTLWRREMTVRPAGNKPRWIDVHRDGQALRAIAFTANHGHPNYVGGLTIEEVADRLAVACGHWGSGADYLRQTILSLESHGIHDDYLWRLQDLVADRILARPQ